MYLINTKMYASQCDLTAKLSVIGATNMIQDHASAYLDELGIGQTKMKNEFGCVWIYAKNKVKFFSPILWNEDISVKVFFSSKTPMRINVDVLFLGSTGDVKMYSKVEMCLFDLATKKPRMITSPLFPNNVEILPTELDEPLLKLRFEDGEKLTAVNVRSTSIDYCRHTNNVEYIRYILDTYSVKELIEKELKGLEINYLSQTHEGDEIEIYKNKDGSAEEFTVKSSGAVVLKCILQY